MRLPARIPFINLVWFEFDAHGIPGRDVGPHLLTYKPLIQASGSSFVGGFHFL